MDIPKITLFAQKFVIGCLDNNENISCVKY